MFFFFAGCARVHILPDIMFLGGRVLPLCPVWMHALPELHLYVCRPSAGIEESRSATNFSTSHSKCISIQVVLKNAVVHNYNQSVGSLAGFSPWFL